MERITEKQLQALVDRLNRVTNSPATPYTRNGDKLTANIGNHHLSWAYGGVELDRMDNQGGGISCPLGSGHGTKRELWDKIHAYIAGIEAGQKL